MGLAGAGLRLILQIAVLAAIATGQPAILALIAPPLLIAGLADLAHFRRG